MCAILCVDIPYFPNTIEFHTVGPESGCNFHSFCIFFDSNGNLIFLVDPVTQGHKGLKGNATQKGRTITETKAEVFDVIDEGLVTSSLCSQDRYTFKMHRWSCFNYCLLLSFGWVLIFLNVSNSVSFCEAIICALLTNIYCRAGLQGR